MRGISSFKVTRFDRDLKLLLFSIATRRMVTNLQRIIFPIYLTLLGFSPRTIGLILSLSIILSAIQNILFSILSDHYGRKTFLLLDATLAVLRFLIISTTQDFWLLTFALGLGSQGQAGGAGQPVISGYVADKVEKKERISIFTTMAILGAIAASIGSGMAGITSIFQKYYDLGIINAHIPLFHICTALSALSVILIFPIKDVVPREKQKKKGKILNYKSKGLIIKFSIVRATTGLGYGLIGSLLPLFLYLRFSVGSDAIGPIFAAADILCMFAYLLVPTIVAKFGEIRTIIWSRMFYAFITAIFAITDWYPLAAISIILFNFIMMFTKPVRQSFATSIGDSEETATIIGISNTARMGARSVAPLIAGYMFEAVNLIAPFLVGSILTAVNGMLYYRWFKPKKEKLISACG